MEISELSLKNLDDIILLEKSCFDNPWNENMIKSGINSKNNVFYGLFDGNKLVGYMCILLSYDIELLRICVIKEYRGRNLSCLLMDKLKEVLQDKNCFLEVESDNFVAINLYKKYNFFQISLRKDYYGRNKDAIIMKR
jgi:[ribosomal protein S18]-alanine N-acetyltransferase